MIKLTTIEDCDRELDRLRELEERWAGTRSQVARLARRRAKALERRIVLQHSDLFAPQKENRL